MTRIKLGLLTLLALTVSSVTLAAVAQSAVDGPDRARERGELRDPLLGEAEGGNGEVPDPQRIR